MGIKIVKGIDTDDGDTPYYEIYDGEEYVDESDILELAIQKGCEYAEAYHLKNVLLDVESFKS